MDAHLDIDHLASLFDSDKDAFQKEIENLKIGVGIYDSHSKPVRCNKAAYELLGLSEDQFLGKSAMDSYWTIVKEDGSKFEPSDFPIIEVITKYEPILGVIMGVSRPLKNDRVWLEVNTHPILKVGGSIRYVICTYKDVTSRYEKD